MSIYLYYRQVLLKEIVMDIFMFSDITTCSHVQVNGHVGASLPLLISYSSFLLGLIFGLENGGDMFL
jgi:hypothetical protein